MSRGSSPRLARTRAGMAQRVAGSVLAVALGAGACTLARASWHVGLEAAAYIVALALLAAAAIVIALRA